MKKLVCETCGSSGLTKEGEYFVCPYCGCKYSVEEAKKMMIEGTVEVQGTVAINFSNQVDSLLKRARLALEDKDFKKADEFAEQALNLDAECGEAYLIKWLRLLGVSSLNEAIQKKDSLANHILGLYKRLEYRYDEISEINSMRQKALRFLHGELLKQAECLFDEIDRLIEQLREKEEEKKIRGGQVLLDCLNESNEPLTCLMLIEKYKKTGRLHRYEDEDGEIHSQKLISFLNVAVRNNKAIKFIERKATFFWTVEGAYNALERARTLDDLKKVEDFLDSCEELLQHRDEVKIKKQIQEKRVAIQKRQEEETRILREKQLKVEQQRKEREVKMQRYRIAGVCQYCGGRFKGLFTKICSSCGKRKDY